MFFIFLSGCLFAASYAAAEDYKVVLLETMPVPIVLNHSQAIVDAFKTLEEKTGWTVEVEILKAQGKKQRATSLLRKSLQKRRPDLVVSVATLATQAAKEVLTGTGIPLLFSVVSDPVGSGILDEVGVASGTNVSGILYVQNRYTKLEIALRILANSRYASSVTFGILCSDYPSSRGDQGKYLELAQLFDNVQFVTYNFPYTSVPAGLPEMQKNLRRGIEAIKDKVDFFWEVSGPLNELASTTQILLASGTPVIMGNVPRAVELGALLSVAVDYRNSGQELVVMAEQVFRGVNVGTLPSTIPEQFSLHINMESAKKLGLTVPSHLLMISGQHTIGSSDENRPGE